MVSDSFGLTVGHAAPEVGSTFRNYHSNDPNGTFEDRIVAETFSYNGLSADLRLIRFATPASQDVKKYTILRASKTAAVGLALNVFGLADASHPSATSVRYGTNTLDRVVNAGTISGIGYDAMLWDYDVSQGQGEARLAGGDSGGPTFSIQKGEPMLIGLHSFVYTEDDGTRGSADIFLPTYVDAINADMAGFGESLSIYSVPEPSSVTFCAILASGFFLRRRKTA